MFDIFLVLIFVVAIALVGFDVIDLLPASIRDQASNLEALRWIGAGFASLLGLSIGLLAQSSYRRLESQFRQTPIEIIVTRAVGLVIGLLVANLMLAPIFLLPIPTEFGFLKPTFAILGSISFAYLGVSLAEVHGRSFLQLVSPNSLDNLLVSEGTLRSSPTKVIDTSCIIDGRLEELLKTGFVEGQILVPMFVLNELQQLADASNDQKRAKGRRGLDILQSMQDRFPKRININPADYEDISTVDAKLIHLTQEINGVLLTNDYNLQKVANLQKIDILNINDLAQAIRPIYLPGDNLELKILKQGREDNQGVGYLEDGTMVVVEEGQSFMGTDINVTVTSSLQTSAGRMIFAKLASSLAT
ncbi:MAG: PIN/TRAM domain-containing protein [Limnothrix sp. RL_2_0]|nr:PIN/TRAM domain-containing protein [Limnothrix sp. RL_2_0]